MNDFADETNCNAYRILIQRISDGQEKAVTFAEEALIDGHARCESCRVWRQQVGEIGTMARALPQFDVPEALTQRIMASVASEFKAEASAKTMIFLAAAVSGAIGYLSFIDTLESIYGWSSWCVGLIFLAALKKFMATPEVMEKAY